MSLCKNIDLHIEDLGMIKNIIDKKMELQLSKKIDA